MSDQPESLILELLRTMRATSDARHDDLIRHMANTNRRLASIERTLARQRADLSADAASNVFRTGEPEERIEVLEAKLARPET